MVRKLGMVAAAVVCLATLAGCDAGMSADSTEDLELAAPTSAGVEYLVRYADGSEETVSVQAGGVVMLRKGPVARIEAR